MNQRRSPRLVALALCVLAHGAGICRATEGPVIFASRTVLADLAAPPDGAPSSGLARVPLTFSAAQRDAIATDLARIKQATGLRVSVETPDSVPANLIARRAAWTGAAGNDPVALVLLSSRVDEYAVVLSPESVEKLGGPEIVRPASLRAGRELEFSRNDPAAGALAFIRSFADSIVEQRLDRPMRLGPRTLDAPSLRSRDGESGLSLNTRAPAIRIFDPPMDAARAPLAGSPAPVSRGGIDWSILILPLVAIAAVLALIFPYVARRMQRSFRIVGTEPAGEHEPDNTRRDPDV